MRLASPYMLADIYGVFLGAIEENELLKQQAKVGRINHP